MPEARDGMPCAPTRRSVLAALGLAVAAVPLAACGIRLEDDAPRVPLLPTREPVPGEGFLVDLWLGSRDLAEEATALGGAATALPARLAVLHHDQAEALRTLLRSLKVPDRVVGDAQARHDAQTPGARAAATPSSASQPAPTGTASAPTAPRSTPSQSPMAAPPSRATLGAAEAGALTADAFTALGTLDRDTVTLPAAALAQRAAAATLLGQPPTWPTQQALSPQVAGAALEASRAAVYGFEVVAAQSRDAQRRLAMGTLATLRARVATLELLAGSSAPPVSLGYPLPFPVTSAATARRLAEHVLTGLRASRAAGAARSAGDVSGLVATLQWLAEAEALCHQWGMPLQPFPGLT